MLRGSRAPIHQGLWAGRDNYGDLEMWVLLIIALASPGAPGGGVHSSMTTLQFQTQAVCENAAKIVNEMNVRSAASTLAVTSSCIQQK